MDLLLDVLWGKSDPGKKIEQPPDAASSSGVSSDVEVVVEPAREPTIATAPQAPSIQPLPPMPMVLKNHYGAAPLTPDSALARSPIQLKEAAEIVANLPGRHVVVHQSDGLTMAIYNGISSFFGCWREDPKKDQECEIALSEIQNMKFIGSGSHGCVFVGEYRGRTVAVKKLKELNVTLKEVRHLRDLKHENIIGFLGACIHPPEFAIVMEYCPRSLREEIKARAIPPELILNWGTQIARGMDYLHKRHFVHRDLKSPNILLSTNDILKISDFGTCREMSGDPEKLSFVGTVAWMAPEVIRNEDCSEKVDVWSYGVVLWELLTREVPYKGLEEAAIVYGVGSNRLQLPVPTGVPDGFSLLLKQCFNTTPKHRPLFRQILLHLEILASDTAFISTPHQTYFAAQADWQLQISHFFEDLKRRNLLLEDESTLELRNQEIAAAQRLRAKYESELAKTSALMQELTVLREQMKRSPKARAAARPGRVRKAGHRRSSSWSSRASNGLRARISSSGEESWDEDEEDVSTATDAYSSPHEE